MPSKKQEVSFPDRNAEELLLIAFGAAQELGWKPQYAGPEALIIYTPRKWNKYNDEILVQAVDGTMTITSTMVHGESFDMMGRNKKNIDAFIKAFEKTKSGTPKPEWSAAMEELRQKTVVAATEQAKDAAEVDSVMKTSSSNLYVTYGIIAINAIVFMLMVINGAGILAPNGAVHIRWGSNYTPLTLTGDWWRLVTCTFIHFGIIHLVMNTYALYIAGTYLEPMLGKARYIIAYLCTGVIAAVVSLWWHADGVNSAGASGAIFGLYGVFLSLLFTNLIPKQIRMALLQSIGIFVVFNLVYGMKSGIDNAAHIGGLLSGMAVGFVYYLSMKREEGSQKNYLPLVIITVVTIVAAWYYINTEARTLPPGTRQKAMGELTNMKFADAEKNFEKMKTINELETEALAPYNETIPLTYAGLSQKLNNISITKWDSILNLLEETKSYNVSEKHKRQTGLLIAYAKARKEEIAVIEKIAKGEMPENNEEEKAINKKISDLLQELKELN